MDVQLEMLGCCPLAVNSYDVGANRPTIRLGPAALTPIASAGRTIAVKKNLVLVPAVPADHSVASIAASFLADLMGLALGFHRTDLTNLQFHFNNSFRKMFG
jgi:hypothetical protein